MRQKGKNNYFFLRALILFGEILFFLLFLNKTVLAADLLFSPSLSNYKINDKFSLEVVVSSPNQSLNAVSGTITFTPDKLKVISLSKKNSIIDFWIRPPSFSNSKGQIYFEGIIFNHGFQGKRGKILTINFEAKSSGIFKINFQKGAILANDGKGTNILENLGEATISISALSTNLPSSDKETTFLDQNTTDVPLAPSIFSLTHPDPEKWYANNQPIFHWTLSPDITAVRLLINKLPRSLPKITYSPPISSKKVSQELDDGIWYFHLQLKNKHGWGGITHYKFQIDTQKPEVFEIKEIPREDQTEPWAIFQFEAHDNLSGIDHYKIRINNQKEIIWRDNQEHLYQTPVLEPGDYILLAEAVDQAGNSLANSINFSIKPLPAPQIIESPLYLNLGEVVVIKGKTIPLSKVTLWVKREKEEPEKYFTSSDENGNFIFVSKDIFNQEGGYQLWAQTTDKRGAKSALSKKITVVVQRPFFIKIGTLALNVLTILASLLGLIFLLVLFSLFSWRKIITIKKRIKKEAGEAEKTLYQTFNLLKKEIDKEINLLKTTKKKRKLTKEEEKIMNNLKANLRKTKKLLKKEISDIKKIK